MSNLLQISREGLEVIQQVVKLLKKEPIEQSKGEKNQNQQINKKNPNKFLKHYNSRLFTEEQMQIVQKVPFLRSAKETRTPDSYTEEYSDNSQSLFFDSKFLEASRINESSEKLDHINPTFSSRIDQKDQDAEIKYQHHEDRDKIVGESIISYRQVIKRNQQNSLQSVTQTEQSLENPYQKILLSRLSSLSNDSLSFSGYPSQKERENSQNINNQDPEKQIQSQLDNSSLISNKTIIEPAKNKREKIEQIKHKKALYRLHDRQIFKETLKLHDKNKQFIKKQRLQLKQFEANQQIELIRIQAEKRTDQKSFQEEMINFLKKKQNVQRSTNQILLSSERQNALKIILKDVMAKKPSKIIDKVIRHLNDGQLFEYKIPEQDYFRYQALVLQRLPINLHKLVTHEWTDVIKLNLRNCSIADAGVLVLMVHIYQFPDLNYLDLSQNNITDHGAKYIGMYLNRCNFLNGLKLENNKITSRGFKYILSAKEQLNYLFKINVNLNQLGDQGFIDFCQNSDHLRYVLNIRFNQNGLTPLSMKYFPQLTTKLAKIKEINLMYNKIGDNGIQYFVESFDNLTCLMFLYLDSNNISDKGFLSMISKILKLKKLEVLHLNANCIWSVKNLQFDALEGLAELRELHLEQNPLTLNGQFISTLLERFQLKQPKFKLLLSFPKQINFSNCSFVKFSNILKMTEKLGLNYISHLDLSFCKLIDRDWECFVKNIFKFYQIVTIKLDSNYIQNITEEDISNISKFVQERQKMSIRLNLQRQLKQKQRKVPEFSRNNGLDQIQAEKLVQKKQIFQIFENEQNIQKEETLKKEQLILNEQTTKPQTQSREMRNKTKKRLENKTKDETHFVSISLINNKLSEASLSLIKSIDRTKYPIYFTTVETETENPVKFKEIEFSSRLKKKIKLLIPSAAAVDQSSYMQKFNLYFTVLNKIKDSIGSSSIKKEFFTEILQNVISSRQKSHPIYKNIQPNQPNLLQSIAKKILKLVDGWIENWQTLKSLSVLEEDVAELVDLNKKIIKKFMSKQNKGKTQKQQKLKDWNKKICKQGNNWKSQIISTNRCKKSNFDRLFIEEIFLLIFVIKRIKSLCCVFFALVLGISDNFGFKFKIKICSQLKIQVWMFYIFFKPSIKAYLCSKAQNEHFQFELNSSLILFVHVSLTINRFQIIRSLLTSA